jgi:hypothetical protein
VTAVTARVARLTEADWQVFAGVRLRALTDSLGERDPQYQQEAAFTAAQWRRRLRDHAQFAALIGDRPVGLIGAQLENAETVYLYSLWLDPAARGHAYRGRDPRSPKRSRDVAQCWLISGRYSASSPRTRSIASTARSLSTAWIAITGMYSSSGRSTRAQRAPRGNDTSTTSAHGISL